MELDALMKFAHAYASLGWAIQKQLDDIVEGNYGDLNPNAIAEIASRLRGYNEDLENAIDEALAAVTREQV